MKRKIILFGFVLILPAVFAVAMGGWDGRAPVANTQVTIKAADPDGLPVTNALVRLCFSNNRHPDKEHLIEKLTDTNGFAVFQGDSSGDVTYRVQKEGYYLTDGRFNEWIRTWRPPNSPNIASGRWQPWNPVFEVVLKPIRNPIPMYVKRVNLGIPEYKKELGFDLNCGDWVAPYGNGTRSDLIISAEKDNPDDAYNYFFRLVVKFSNQEDGICMAGLSHPLYGSRLKSDYSAFVDGYDPEWIQIRHRTRDKIIENNRNPDRIFYFRIRTKLDDHGNIISAHYGKIYGDFLNFTYYLNPEPNDRNVEFDPEKNLFGGRDRFAP